MNVLVTGAGKGLGLELCKLFSEAGHTIFPLVRTKASAHRIMEATNERCIPIVTDLHQDACMASIEQVLQEHVENLDLLINNAGIISSLPDYTLDQVTTESIAELVNIHCLGAVRCVKACKPFLLRSDQPVVLNISSRLGSLQRIGEDYYGIDHLTYSYSIAKAAQNMFTVCMDRELTRNGVATYAIHPGVFESALNHGTFDWSAKDAAINLVSWLDKRDTNDPKTGRFLFPNHEEIPW